MRRIWFPVLMGVVGVAILAALGVWQVQRLGQKEAMLSAIAARIGDEPTGLPDAPDPVADQYRPVRVAGALSGEEVHVLTAAGGGPAYRIVAALTAGDRRVMVDLGTVPEAAKDAGRMAERVEVTGNLLWPQESDRFTPEPDLGDDIWFARDVDAMAAALGTEPLLVVARTVEGADLGTEPRPVDTAGIPNDHLQYAITWFGLAAVWAGMSVWLIRRAARGTA